MKYKRIFFLIVSNALLITLFMTSIGNTRAAPNDVAEVDIATSPTKVLFDVDNMKPGDSATRSITISNKGQQDFDYTMSTDLKAGSKKLYQELNLKVSDSEGELFNGKLDGFKGFEARTLVQSASEDLTFTVEFPAHLGNDFQGLATEVEFKFYVQGTLGGLLPVDGPKLPDTGTNTFKILAMGMLLAAMGFTLMMVQRFRKRRLDFNRS
jgi:LPXTG-motif cell wall-anchored protein